jgi:SAM-dependent methyltransferase
MPKCNFCKSELIHVFADLGFQPPSNSFLTKEQLLKPETYYPLTAYVCDKCYLVQVPETKMAKDIFSKNYPYFSSDSPSNVSHAKEFADIMVERFKPKRVLEIGSNDGYMLQWFAKKDIRCYGIDPSPSPAQKALNVGFPTYLGFFGMEWSKMLIKDIGHFDLICGINVLAHQPDINDFVEGLRIALVPDGVIVMEFPWLVRTMEGMQFDQVYHEHFSYFSFTIIDTIFWEHGLEIFDIDELSGHGGSLRIYARHLLNRILPRSGKLIALMMKEKDAGILTLDYYFHFQSKVNDIKVNLMEFLYDVKFAEGATVVAYGAAAKANTFLNYCGIKPDLIDFIVDRSPHKQNLYCPGSHIPVVDESKLKEVKPDYVLITAWNLKDEIMEQLKYIGEWGGKFIVAIPELEVI